MVRPGLRRQKEYDMIQKSTKTHEGKLIDRSRGKWGSGNGTDDRNMFATD